jgi:ATP adenylyltransferase
MEYIRSLAQQDSGECFLCKAVAAAESGDAAKRRQNLVLWSSDQSIVMINLYPYANGHLLVAPRAHKSELESLSPEESLDLTKQTAAAVRLLKRAVSAQGFNIGINLGRVAGAGLPGHVHQHIVPRWGGDTNFMSIVGETRVIPQAMSQLYEELLRVRQEIGG